MPDRLLTREQIEAALHDLVGRLRSHGEEARIYLVGGAALSVAYHARDATRDVDAFYSNPSAVDACAREVAEARGLPDDWLNNRALGFQPLATDDPAPLSLIDAGGVSVTVASLDVLLAMKVRASRPLQDLDDIRFLLGKTGVGTRSAVLSFASPMGPPPLP